MAGDPRGIRGALTRVAAHLSTLARLQKELARTELEGKGGKAAAGAALAIGAGVLALFALGFGLATAAAALALVVDWWLALLIVFVILVLVVVALALGSRALFRSVGSLRPEQTMEEAELTKQALRDFRAR